MSPFLAWGDFHARSRFAPSTIPEEKGGLLVVYLLLEFVNFPYSENVKPTKNLHSTKVNPCFVPFSSEVSFY